MTDPAKNKTDQGGHQPTEAERNAAWEIRNGILNRIDNPYKWTEQYVIDDDMLRDYIGALVTTGIEQWQIGNVAAAVNRCRQKTEPYSRFSGDERDPFSLTGLWRLKFAFEIDQIDMEDSFFDPKKSPDYPGFDTWTEKMAADEDKYLYEYSWSHVLKEREELERDRAEEKAKMAADPYEWVRVNDGPPLLGYHDRHQLLPRYRDGGIGLIVGEKNHLKTTVTVMLLVEAMVADSALHILYLAGEQPADVLNKARHYGTAAGLTADDIFNRFRIRRDLPPLPTKENSDGVLAAAKRFNAGIVIVDTYQHAITGLDENGSKAAELSTNAGVFGRLKSNGRLVLILVDRR
jgi:hypothetical protein